MTMAAPVTHLELQRAWRALAAGAFRDQAAVSDELPGAAVFTDPVVAVAGCHGWAGTSTAALMLAEACARRGTPVRLLDAAAASRSGFAAAAATEHGLDETGRWRLGSRGQVAVHRSAGPLAGVLDVPPPPVVGDGTVTVVDAGWPIADLLACRRTHWLPRLLRDAPLLLTARPSVPGLRHVEVTLEQLTTVTSRSTQPFVLLLGARRRWRQAGTGALLLAAESDRRVHLVPEHGALASAGLTPVPLPRQLHPVGDRLAELTAPTAAPADVSLHDFIHWKDSLS